MIPASRGILEIARSLAATLLLLSCSGVYSDMLPADELPSVTPYRPTVSNPAELSAARHLEIEAGFEHVNSGGLKERLATPVTLKYAFNRDWGIMFGRAALEIRQTACLLPGYAPLTSYLQTPEYWLGSIPRLGRIC